MKPIRLNDACAHSISGPRTKRASCGRQPTAAKLTKTEDARIHRGLHGGIAARSRGTSAAAHQCSAGRRARVDFCEPDKPERWNPGRKKEECVGAQKYSTPMRTACKPTTTWQILNCSKVKHTRQDWRSEGGMKQPTQTCCELRDGLPQQRVRGLHARRVVLHGVRAAPALHISETRQQTGR